MAPRDPYLTRRGNTFYFRRAFPAAVVGRVTRKELNLSLRTASLATARKRCRVVANVFESAVKQAERMPELTRDTIHGLVRTYFQREWERMNERVWMISDDPVADPADELKGAEDFIKELQGNFGSHSIDNSTRIDASQLLQESGFGKVAPASEGFEEVALGVLRARIEALRIFTANLQGKTNELAPKDPLFDGIVVTGMPALPDDEGSVDRTLAGMVADYCDFKIGADWAERTAKEYRRGLNMFADFAGSPSRPEVTSSSSKTRGLSTSARARPNRWRSPVDRREIGQSAHSATSPRR
jgi:hypothetical protein